MFKGRDVMGGPDWAGWGFNRTPLQIRLYTAAEANAASNSVLMVEPVFDDDPDWMLETNQLSQVQINQLLASGIPALSYAAGLSELLVLNGYLDNNTIKSKMAGIRRCRFLA